MMIYVVLAEWDNGVIDKYSVDRVFLSEKSAKLFVEKNKNDYTFYKIEEHEVIE